MEYQKVTDLSSWIEEDLFHHIVILLEPDLTYSVIHYVPDPKTKFGLSSRFMLIQDKIKEHYIALHIQKAYAQGYCMAARECGERMAMAHTSKEGDKK